MARLMDVTPDRNVIKEAAALFRDADPAALTVVFPAKRAGHAFRLEWVRSRGAPAIAPEVLTMEELLRRAAGVPDEQEADEADCVYLLFKAAGEVFGDSLGRLTTDIASFYPWGAAWLRAMEELERERVAPERLRELSNLEETGERGRVLYSRFAELRETFHSMMAQADLYTPGMLFDRALDRISSGEYPIREKTAFVGLFALTAGERELLKAIDGTSEVTILRIHDGREWSAFDRMERMLVPEGDVRPTDFKPDLSGVRFHSNPGAHAEVLEAGVLLRRWKEEGTDPSRIAVVLPDPGLLPPLLWEGVGNLGLPFNVTMGYPLRRTPLYALLDKVMTLSETANGDLLKTTDYLEVLLHPYVKNLRLPIPGGESTSEQTRIMAHAVEEFLKKDGRARVAPEELGKNDALSAAVLSRTGGGINEAAFASALGRLHALLLSLPRARTPGEGATALLEIVRVLDEKSPAGRHPFFSRFLFAAVRTIEKVQALRVADEPLSDARLIVHLLRRAFDGVNIPFSGLPMKGLQVLGLLETRALSFDRVLILDANEGVLPPTSAVDPVLPPSLRARLGLSTRAERVEVSRYHLTMLISGSREAHLLWIESPEKARSRFVEELLFLAGESDAELRETPVENFSYNFGPGAPVHEEVCFRALSPIVKLSPSEIDNYLKCPARFFLASVAGIREPEDRLREIDHRAVGSIVHRVLKKLYSSRLDSPLGDEDYVEMLAALPGLVKDCFPPSGQSELTGRLVVKKLGAFIRGEKKEGKGIVVTGVEVPLERTLTVGSREILIKGRADRVHRSGNAVIVFDYKTGEPPHEIETDNFEEIEKSRVAIAKRIPSFQLPLYAYMLKERVKSPEEVNAAYVELKPPDAVSRLLFRERKEGEEWMSEIFIPTLEYIVGGISDPETTFAADPLDEKQCSACPFKGFCSHT